MAEIPHIQNPVIAHAKANGWFVRRTQWIGRVGCPDAVFAKGGVELWIEFKDEGRATNLIQQREHQRMLEAGMKVFVIDKVSDGRELLDRHDPA